MTGAKDNKVKAEPKRAPSPREGGSSAAFLWVILFLFVAYPLSIGPAARVHQRFPATRPFIETVYKPLTLLIENCSPVRNATLWYVSKIWRVD